MLYTEINRTKSGQFYSLSTAKLCRTRQIHPDACNFGQIKLEGTPPEPEPHWNTALPSSPFDPKFEHNVADLMNSKIMACIKLELIQHLRMILQAALLCSPCQGNVYSSILVSLQFAVWMEGQIAELAAIIFAIRISNTHLLFQKFIPFLRIPTLTKFS